MSPRSHQIQPTDPGGEPVCLLTPDGARARHVPIDRLLELGTIDLRGAGYQVRLPPGEESWALANAFAQEEATCCPALALEVAEFEAAVVVSATF